MSSENIKDFLSRITDASDYFANPLGPEAILHPTFTTEGPLILLDPCIINPDILARIEVPIHPSIARVVSRAVAKPRIQSADATSWIKRENHIAPTGGIRKRRVTHKSPFERQVKKNHYHMARPATTAQYERHALLMMSNILNIRSNASPFTLILDDLNQQATPLINEMVLRALSRNINVVLVSFEATRVPPAVRIIPAYGDRTSANILSDLEKEMSNHVESLVIIDSMYDAVVEKHIEPAALFDMVVTKCASTLVGIYHHDLIPEPSTTVAGMPALDSYAPTPVELLKFMATTIVSCRSLSQVLAYKAARARSLAAPTFGMFSGAAGIVQDLTANSPSGIVLECEFRRRSGRPETESFFLRASKPEDYHHPIRLNPLEPSKQAHGTLKREFVVLLAQHPPYASEQVVSAIADAGDDEDLAASTFKLELTDKQKRAREDVVLPYFDAQKGEGGEGGRILYDMGEEDDFDEEEDEI